jgi:hypothetical protein
MPLDRRLEARYCPRAVLPVSLLSAAKLFTSFDVQRSTFDVHAHTDIDLGVRSKFEVHSSMFYVQAFGYGFRVRSRFDV